MIMDNLNQLKAALEEATELVALTKAALVETEKDEVKLANNKAKIKDMLTTAMMIEVAIRMDIRKHVEQN